MVWGPKGGDKVSVLALRGERDGEVGDEPVRGLLGRLSLHGRRPGHRPRDFVEQAPEGGRTCV